MKKDLATQLQHASVTSIIAAVDFAEDVDVAIKAGTVEKMEELLKQNTKDHQGNMKRHKPIS